MKLYFSVRFVQVETTRNCINALSRAYSTMDRF